MPLDLAYFNHHDDIAQFFLSAAGALEDKNQEEGGLSAAVESVEIEGDEDKDEKKDSA